MKPERVAVYYINLDPSTERRASIEAQLADAEIADAKRVAAFDGRKVALKDATDYDDREAIRFLGRSVFNGEYGCYRSHLDALRQFVGSDAAHALIIEDDAQISPDLMSSVGTALATLSDKNIAWDLLHLSASKPMIMTRHVAAIRGEMLLLRAYYFPMTTTALLWSRATAMRFLRDFATISMPVDMAIREMMVAGGKGFALAPPPVATTGVISDIDSEGDARKRQGRHWSYGYCKQRRLWKNKIYALYRKLTEPV